MVLPINSKQSPGQQRATQPTGQQPPTPPIGRTQQAMQWTYNKADAWVGAPLRTKADAWFGAPLRTKADAWFGAPLRTYIVDPLKTALVGPFHKEILQLKEWVKKSLTSPEDLTIDDVRPIDKHLKTLLSDKAKLLRDLFPTINLDSIDLCQSIANMLNSVISSDNSLRSLNRLKEDFKNEGAQKRLQDFDHLLDGILKYNKDKGYLNTAKSGYHQIEQFTKRATIRANPLLLELRAELKELERVIRKNDKGPIQKSSRTLKKLLNKVIAQKDTVFSEEPLTDEDMHLLRGLKKDLHFFYDNQLPSSEYPAYRENMLGHIKTASTTIEHYYKVHDGHVGQACAIATGEADKAVEKVEKAIRDLLVEGKQQLTGQAKLPLLRSRETLFQLLEAINDIDIDAIPSLSRDLEQSLEEMIANATEVFSKTPISEEDLSKLQELKNYLPNLYGMDSNSLDSLGNGLKDSDYLRYVLDYFEPSRLIIEGHYKTHEGAIGQLNDGFQKNIERAEKTIQETEKSLRDILAKTNKKMTEHAPFVLLDSREKLLELQQAIIDDRTADIQEFSKELESLLRQLVEQKKDLFSKKALPDVDEASFNRLGGELPSFYSANPPEKKEMLGSVKAVLFTIERHYNDYEGIFRQVGDSLQKNINPMLARLKGLVAETNETVTGGEAYRLLSNAGQKLTELQKGIKKQDIAAIQKSSSELEPFLNEIIAKSPKVFTKGISEEELSLLNALKNQLPNFCREDGLSLGDMPNVVEASFSIIDRHCKAQEGTAAKVGTILQEKITTICSDLLKEVDAKLNDQAHYLLPEVCNKLTDLRQAINGNNKAAIQTMSFELEQLLRQMLENRRRVFTKTALTDEHEDLLDRFTTLVLPHFYSDNLYDHDEMLARVEFVFSIIEPYYKNQEGTIGRAGNALHRRITATFDDILKKGNTALNRRAHHLLPDTRRKLSELRQLINNKGNNKVAIQESMSELERLLGQMLANKKRVFTNTPLTNRDRTRLHRLQNHLHHYYNEASPDRERMLRRIESGFDIINFYYTDHQGTFGQTLDSAQAAATNTGKVLLGHAENTAEKVISNGDEKFTGGEAYSLLSDAREKLNELKTAIIVKKKEIGKKKESIRKSSGEVRLCLAEIRKQLDIFTKPPISDVEVRQLNTFIGKLPSFYSDTPPTQDSMQADVVTALSTIEHYCKEYEGTVSRMAKIFNKETIKPAIAELGHLAKTNWDNLWGKTTSDGSADAGASNGEGTVSDFLSEGGALLEQILGKGTEAISKRALGGLASILTLGLQHVIDKMGDSADFLQPKMALNGIIMLIGGVRENGNWQGLWKHLKDVAVVMRPIKIYMNGFLLPRIGSGESEAYRLLSGARKELNALKKGIDSNDNGSIQTASNALRKLLEEIKAESNTVFKKIPITEESHVNALNALIERLPRGADGIPPDQKEATLGVIKTGLATLEHYCGRYEGEVEKAEEVYFDQVNALQKAKDTSPVDPDDQNWEKLAEVEKTKLVKHTTKFLTIKHIYENICHLNPDDGERFYVRLLIKSQQNTLDPDGELKKLFFEELENKKVNFLIRLYARIQYFFYSTIVGSYVAEASNIYFNEIFDYIKQHKEEKFDTLRNQVTTNFTRYLTILGEAYRNVAKNPTATGTLTEMLKSELEKKESNLGFESKELYSQFAQIVIRKTLKSRFLSWLGEKFIGDPEKIVRTVIDKSLDSLLNTNGYTHALNIVIREQLQEIWTLLQADEASGQSTFTPETLRLSDVRKSELSGLVKNFFEILSKSKCQTKDELRNLIKGQILSKKINQGIDSLFIEEIIEKVTDLLAFVLQSLAEKDQPQKLTYKFASLVNRTYEVDEQVTLQDMQAEERKISKLSEQILGLAVNTAVKEQFDFTGNQQQEETDHFVHELQGRFTTFYTLKEDLVALKEEKGEIENKIDGILEKTQAFTTQCYDLSFQVRSSKINSDNKEDLDKQYLGLAHLSGPLVEAVIQLKNHHQVLKNIQAIVPPLSQIRKIAGDVPPRLSSPGGPTNEDLTFCDNQLFILDNTHLKELKKMRYLPELAELVEKIDAAQRVFATTLIDVRDQIKIKAFSTAQSQPNSLLEQIAKEKKESLGSIMKNEALASKLATLTQEVKNTFDKNKKLLTQLVNKLKEIENANSSEKIDAATKDFIRLYQQAMIEANVSIETLKGNYNRSHQRLLIDINGTGFLNPNQDETSKRGIQDSIQHAQEHLETLATWKEQHVKKVAHIDFAVPEIMKRLQDFASRFVGGRVKERLDGFMSFLKREETYRYGLINHLSMIPYVQANQPKN